jgi:hypothetical protein
MTKRIGYIVSIAIFLIFLKGICYAADPSIYFGTWKTKDGHPEIILMIKSETDVTLEINKKLISNPESDFTYSKSGKMPFLSLVAEGADLTHYLYLIIGSNHNVKDAADYNILRGFYAISKPAEPRYKKGHIKYYQVELIKVKK